MTADLSHALCDSDLEHTSPAQRGRGRSPTDNSSFDVFERLDKPCDVNLTNPVTNLFILAGRDCGAPKNRGSMAGESAGNIRRRIIADPAPWRVLACVVRKKAYI